MNHPASLIQSESFEAYPVDKLIDNSVTDFDLFVQIADHTVLYSGPGYRWSRDELTGLLRSGHEHLRIRLCDQGKARMYRACALLPELRRDLAPTERMQSIEELGAKFSQCLFEGELTDSCVSKANQIAADLTDCVLEDQHSILGLGDLINHDFYTFHHSVRVAAYTVAIAVSMGMSDPGMLRDLAVGGIFHDIGKKEVPLGLLNKAGALTEAEWAILRSHPMVGHDSLKQSNLAVSTKEIILHHHEKRSGQGYPHGLDKNQLLPEVQIATLADIFDALTSARAYQSRRSRFEALDFIKTKLLATDVWPDAFKALVGCLSA